MAEILEAIVFGSLGTIGETSELHRNAFNQTFEELGLEWHWSVDTYNDLLETVGGKDRILAFARSHGDASVTVSTATELHAYKTKVYADLVRQSPSVLRPGVARLVREARSAGVPLGLATSTTAESLHSNFDNFGDLLTLDHFDEVITISDLDRGKPAPDAHVVCMSRLKVRASRTVAIEDTEASVASAFIAGATVVATPGAHSGARNYSSAAVTVSSLGDPEDQAFLIGDGPRLDDGMVTLRWLSRLIDVVA
ncbi:MAG: HAD-IA family hydrolase [Acidimicrobiia bacterium]|nr:HAD-IA family hydrolase [Acidimicrobiia bacterium]